MGRFGHGPSVERELSGERERVDLAAVQAERPNRLISMCFDRPLEASVAQSVGQLIRNQQVGGSIPLAGPT